MNPARRAVVTSLLATSITFAAAPTTNPVEPEQAAFAQLRDPDDLLLRQDFDPDTAPLDATVAAYLAKRRPAIDLLLQAAKLPQADWGEPGTDIQRQLDDSNVARTAVRLTWLAARYDAANGRPARAVDEMLAGIAVARHTGQRNLLVCHLVECGSESGAIDRLATLLPALPKDVVETLPAKLDALPPSSGLARTIEGERAFGMKMLMQQINAVPPAAANNNPPPDPTPRGKAEAAAERAKAAEQEAAGKAAATLQANAMAPFYDAAKKAAGQSPDEFQKSMKAAAAALPGNPFVQILAPSLGRARISSAVVETKRAMLRGAIAVALRGDGELAAHKDPFGDGPFRREPTPGGYTLTGTIKTGRGEAVVLRVGR